MGCTQYPSTYPLFTSYEPRTVDDGDASPVPAVRAATAAATGAAQMDTICRALGDGGGGQRHDAVGDGGGGGQRHHTVTQCVDASGGQRQHWASWKRQERRDDSVMPVCVDWKFLVEAAMGPDHSTRVTATLSPVWAKLPQK